MRRIRRPSHATVVAYVALFIALGGTAVAAVVVSDNSQVAPGTISGHEPPNGKHSNLITGSVNETDLARDSVGTAKVKDGSLEPADMSLPAATIVAKPRGGTIGTGDGTVNYPLADATWTQKAHEVEAVLGGEVSLVVPTTSECTRPEFSTRTVSVAASVVWRQAPGGILAKAQVSGGNSEENLEINGASPGETVTLPLVVASGGSDVAYGFEPGASTQRTMHATVEDNCANPGEEWTIKSLKVDVIGYR